MPGRIAEAAQRALFGVSFACSIVGQHLTLDWLFPAWILFCTLTVTVWTIAVANDPDF